VAQLARIHPTFRRDAARSYGDAASESMLIHGENLAAMRWLARDFAGAIRCIYLDPPFNTGRTFAEYDDARGAEAWRTMITERLVAARALLSDDGAIFVEIDDTELAPLHTAMDDVFGRTNRIATITIVRSASTGHKAINRGVVNVADYLLVYARDRARVRLVPQRRERRGYDAAYSTWIERPADPPAEWTFEPLGKHVAGVLGTKPTKDQIAAFAMKHAAHVVRFAQPRYEAVSRDARALIDRSHAEPSRVHVLERSRHKPMFLYRGNRVLFLADKVRTNDRGARVLVEPLTNVWDDVPFQGIAKEGGVAFIRNKKPERLIARIVAMASAPGDWVLDPFVGSGTTAAVAHKMGRRWIGIDDGEHVDTMCLPRLRRVVDGTDATGITRAAAWPGGGGFSVHA
jgi:adenine-specific DNA-methyltransferase